MLDANKDAMSRLVKGLESNKSEMIRRLAGAGYRQADVARFLGVRDQFVSNVVRSEKSKATDRRSVISKPASQSADLRARLTLYAEGRISIPPALRAAMAVASGDEVIARVVDGELRVATPAMAVKRVQKMVRELIPGNDSLADSLIADRREEAAREAADE
jgi:bifunctional DNA-binding transcriptional regulator/antitoxin component of YhaV-PrlF toxin-antitoxin module